MYVSMHCICNVHRHLIWWLLIIHWNCIDYWTAILKTKWIDVLSLYWGWQNHCSCNPCFRTTSKNIRYPKMCQKKAFAKWKRWTSHIANMMGSSCSASQVNCKTKHWRCFVKVIEFRMNDDICIALCIKPTSLDGLFLSWILRQASRWKCCRHFRMRLACDTFHPISYCTR